MLRNKSDKTSQQKKKKKSFQDLSERGTDGWFMLEKNEERAKERGSIHLAGTVTSKAPLENKSRQSYDALLARLVHHQNTATNNNNEVRF